ncbi:malto-oligosyltrehalose trehalohydrolase [Sulfuricystis multivorans]|uniref:malto-oligosyltrehalose trehalohydrolase n=1 Tax=Sulfuricystis multivorans TaxID=2211108 RepID=UPI0024DFD919|nr:malto-oligosyltrehalose trehalohydrolase [Sulfuricystis multivorans]
MMNRFSHAMPFGARVTPVGVHFGLWAPSALRVILHIEGDPPAEYPMTRDMTGWHTLELATAAAGTRYRFRVSTEQGESLLVPDPASRYNPDDVHGPSEVIDPTAFVWPTGECDWSGRPWHEAVIYELHIGTFSPPGDFAGAEARLDHLLDLGVTAIELMPVADFPGRRNWGYDGVLPFAPDSAYGRPEDLKRLVASAHARGLMVFLDVVFNHFGPEGNYLHCYCPEFFDPHHRTPWGAAISFAGKRSRIVRDFFVHNALYWLEEYRLDGLRLDAVHAIRDETAPDIVEEIRDAVLGFAAAQGRHIHLILENDRNQARYLETRRWQDGSAPGGVAQWNDDFHHALHVILTGETDGYYADYADDPFMPLARCLAEGFAWQGQVSPYREGAVRGEPSGHLPPTVFVDFLQTHDQIGNRAFGERLCHLAPTAALEAATAVLILSPSPPLLFMGEEFAARQPFLYFCDFGPELAAAVTAGRRAEFARFARFADPGRREDIPDPNDAATFSRCVLDWDALDALPQQRMLTLYKRLLALRSQEIVPRLAGIRGGAHVTRLGVRALRAQWLLGDDSCLIVTMNLAQEAQTGIAVVPGRVLFALPSLDDEPWLEGRLPPWSVIWQIDEEGR